MQILLGHTKIESTVRYLGVDIEDALALAEGTGGLVSDGLPCLNAEGSTSIPRTSAKRRVRSPLTEVRRVLPTGRTLKDADATRCHSRSAPSTDECATTGLGYSQIADVRKLPNKFHTDGMAKSSSSAAGRRDWGWSRVNARR
jgi:hypothetical protein